MKARTALFVASILLLCACIPAPDEPVAARTPRPVAGARPGGTFTVAISEPDGIDPGNAHEPAGMLVASTMCDTLITFDPATGAPRPALASSWTITPGGEKLFVRLRKGIVFSDGSPVTADDVAFTLSRLASERYASGAASLLEPIDGYGFVHGDADAPNERARRELLGVRAADERTVEISLQEARADFFRVLGHPATSPVSRDAVERDPAAFARAPVCAGPYRAVAPWEPGARIVLERSGSYAAVRPDLTRGGAGYADRIRLVPVADAAAAYRRGGIDLARMPRDEAGAIGRPSGRIEFIGLPTSVEPFDDPKVRVALSRALDRTAIAAAFPSPRVPAAGFVPNGVSDVYRSGACAGNAPAAGDRRAALGALNEAGIDLAATTIRLTYNDELGNRIFVAAVAEQWEATFGLRVVLDAVAFETLMQRGQSTQGLVNPFRTGWTSPFPSADAAMVPLFTAGGIGRDNLSRYSSAAFDDFVGEARRTDDNVERRDAYRRAEDVLCAEMPMIPVTIDRSAWLLGERIMGAIDDPLGISDGAPVLREISVR